MKRLTLYSFVIALAAVTMVSCKPDSLLQKEIRGMGIRFKPLTRNDITLVGNLSAEVTISGKGTNVLDKSFLKNQKIGMNYKEKTSIIYFAPGQGEAITGSLFESDIFEAAATSTTSQQKLGFLNKFIANLRQNAAKAAKQSATPVDFGFYALIEKYPDVDYFVNVRFDRKRIVTGKGKWTETVIVKADGIKLKTD